MAFLGKAKKQDLVLLAEELGQKVSDKMTNIELRNIIIGSKDYEEEFVRDQLSVILEERFERESEEKIARQLAIEEEKIARQLAIEQQQREFELEKMRLEIERSRFDSENLSPLKTSVSDLIKIIPNFDIRDGDIVLFLTLFERQAKRIGVENRWVSALLARMPPDITQLIARESEDKFDNYDYIKGVLLKRFKMSPETFRQKFMKHQRIPARSWRDFVFEITSYFEEWLDGMESQRYKLPFKQEPKQPTFKPTCYSCGRVGHTSRVCHAKNHKKTSPTRQINAVETNERFQEQSSAILTAKVAIPAVIDTGAQISVVRADVVEGQSVDSGGTIQIMSAFGEREVTELKIFNLKIDDSRHGRCLENVQFIHNPANFYVSSRAVEGITADDPKSISSQEMTRETYPSEIYIQAVSKANEEEQLPEGRGNA
ncbi:retrovirus-related Pol polyprotein from transposon 297 [Trichonephila clavipes]|nr:retrovirus-related Pol polyprotein from transposon 297 [Trichonephila clavipes]